MKKRINIKHFRRLYKMNRLWGDGVIEATYYALRGKAFTVQFESRIKNDEDILSDRQI
jgi:hypothetical protein